MPQVKTTVVNGKVEDINIVYDEDEMALAARAAAILGLEVDELDPDDFWLCPGCGQVNTLSLVHASDAMPMAHGSMFETCCGHCRGYFAPKYADDGSRNPILSECYTHVDHYGDEDDD